MNGICKRDKLQKQIMIINKILKYMYNNEDNSISYLAEVEKLKNKQMIVETISKFESGDSLTDEFILREMDHSISDIKTKLDRLIQNLNSKFLTFDSLKFLSRN